MSAIDVLRRNQTSTTGNFRLIENARFARENADWLPYSTAIAVRVHSRMKELGMTQKKLADAMGCTQQYISVLLKGRENLTLETIAKLEMCLQFHLLPDLIRLVDGYGIYEPRRTYLSEGKSPEYGKKW